MNKEDWRNGIAVPPFCCCGLLFMRVNRKCCHPEGAEGESRDLGTDCTANIDQMRRSFDFAAYNAASLRMTTFSLFFHKRLFISTVTNRADHPLARIVSGPCPLNYNLPQQKTGVCAPVFVYSACLCGRMYAGELFPSPLLFASNRCAVGDTLDSPSKQRFPSVVTFGFCS